MPGLVFFIDVDNTLIDNDGVKKDPDAHTNFRPDITVLHICELIPRSSFEMYKNRY